MSLLTDESGMVGRVDDELVLVERAGRRATVTMNDPLSLNALTRPLTVRLREALEDVVADAGVGVVVLAGTDPAFSAGVAPVWPSESHAASPGLAGDGPAGVDPAGDDPVGDNGAQSPADGEIVLDPGDGDGTPGAVRWELAEIARLIGRSGKPFIAGVNGVAAGAGLALALACDVVIMSHSARLDPASGRVGLLPEVGMSWLLTRRLGYHRTLSLFTQGHHLSAVEATQSGLVDVAVRHDQLESVVSFWCHVANLAATPDMAKPLVRSATESGLGRAAVMGEFAA
jgi:2-(1,2-epoxy-1,2-dihydrophenyl)acetyl-CoA isomerase